MAEIKQQGVNQNPTPETNEAVATPAVSAPTSAAPSSAALSTAAATTISAPDLSDEAKKLAQKAKRTPGLKLFDVLLYPFINNISVFLISVGATYLTSRGHVHADQIKGDGFMARAFRGTANFFQNRGDWMVQKFEKLGMSHKQADMGKMVFFSFFDGTFIAPVIKLFEDRRERIAHWIDTKIGTKSEDLSVYAAEPKQTWLSVIGGRLATAAIVVPTAVALDTIGKHNGKIAWKNESNKNGHVSLNDIMFNNPGLAAGEKIEAHPKARKWFGSLDVKELSKIGFFEAFYTSVCTGGLYLSSRFFARGLEKSAQTTYNRTHASAPKGEAQPTVSGDEQTIVTTERTAEEKPAEKPSPKLQHVAEAERLSQLPAQAVGV